MNAHGSRGVAIVVAGGLLLLLTGIILFLGPSLMFPKLAKPDTRAKRELSRFAFNESYLNAANGKISNRRTDCQSCHPVTDARAQQKSSLLNGRSALSREDWARAIPVQAKCGVCHLAPDPSNLPRQSWREVMSRMAQIMDSKGVTKLTDDEFQDVLHFYFTFSPETQPPLADDPDPLESPLKFERSVLGNPAIADSRDPPFLGRVQIVDLDQDGKPDVLVCDIEKSAVTWVHNQNGVWREETLATVRNPGHAQVIAGKRAGPLDIVVGCLGTTRPTDDLMGNVVLLSNDGAMRFTPVTLLDQVSRVADVEAGDFDGDGDTDFVVAMYGFLNQGEVGWLESKSDKTCQYHLIVKKTGAINMLPVDLNGDGHLDFVALFAQEHEEVSAFINDGTHGFQEHVLFKAATPSFGSSGIQLVDLDKDGDLDILYTNGDNLDLPTIIPRPYHGVQWLENRGNLNFVWHDLYRCYGAYSAVAADLDNDGDLDIVVTTLFNDWSDPKRASLLWLENDSQQRFIPHSIATQPTHLISAAIGDLDGDGWLDIVACGMHGFPPFDRIGRLTLWKNRRARR
ncbi:MAG: FG-GAP-like repeat-containing protein [Verrucomicrobiota bacterium]